MHCHDESRSDETAQEQIMTIMNDPQFPQLAMALKPALMQDMLQETLVVPTKTPRPRFLVDSCLIGEKRYKPWESCVLSYDLQLRDLQTGSSRKQVVSARLCKPREGLKELHEAKRRKLSPTPGLVPLAHLPGTEMVVWVFPNDRKLTHLPQLLNLEFLASHLPAKLASLELDASNDIDAISAEVLHYLPERSCMIRYRLTAKRRSTGESYASTLYGKIYRDDHGSETYSVMRQLAEQIPGTAVPLAYDQDLRTLWQSHVPGHSFIWDMLQGEKTLSLLHAIGQCLGEFHRCSIQTPSRFGLPDIKASLTETVDVARRAYPEMADRIQSLVNRLLAQCNSMRWTEQPMTPIHRDLKLSNFLFDRETFRLIDLDCVCIGHPLTDIASMITNIHLNGIRAGCSNSSINAIVTTFCSAYREAVSYPVSIPHLNWYTAAAFIHEVIRRSMRQLDTVRLKHMTDYLDLSEHYASA